MFFSLLKSKLQKKQGLYYEDLNNNIKAVIKTIPEDSRRLQKTIIREY